MKKRKVLTGFLATLFLAMMLIGCGKQAAPTGNIDLADGVYTVGFETDSTMFHVNETMNGKAILTVTDKCGMLHLLMPSKNILNLYPGLAEDAKKKGAELISPSMEEVTYADGLTEEVYAYDVPVYVLDEEFDLAIIGKKEKWYDHKVKISGAEPFRKEVRSVELSFEGGTGKVTLQSPTDIKNSEEGYLVTLVWSSKNYDYMIVDGVKYLPLSNDGCSVFEIPVKDLNTPLTVIADTVAMSTPHEIEYVITFDTASLQ